MAPPAAVGQLDPSDVQIGTANGPGIYLAPAGTDGPATAQDDWAAPWRVLGYLSDDGPTIGQDNDSETITPWQSRVPIRTVITARGVTLQFVLWQINPMTLALYFDTDVPEDTGEDDLDMDIRTDTQQHVYAVGIDARDTDQVLRLIFPRASLSDAGDMQIQAGAAVPLDCTLSALDDGGRLVRIVRGKLAPNGVGADGYATGAGALAAPVKGNGKHATRATVPVPAVGAHGSAAGS